MSKTYLPKYRFVVCNPGGTKFVLKDTYAKGYDEVGLGPLSKAKLMSKSEARDLVNPKTPRDWGDKGLNKWFSRCVMREVSLTLGEENIETAKA